MGTILETIAKLILGFGEAFMSLFGGDPRVKKIQEVVVKGCGFLPTAASVTAMLTAPNPAVTGVIGIALAICQVASASKTEALGLVSQPGTVNGVPVEGDWVVK